MERDFYEVVMTIITPRILWISAGIVAAGWLIRLGLDISYAPPKAAKVTAAIVFFLLMIFYMIADFYPEWPLDHFQALSRIVFVLLMLHELAHHVYVTWLYGRLNGAHGDV